MRHFLTQRAVRAPLSVLGLMVAAGPLVVAPASAPDPVTPAETAYRRLAPLPAGSSARTRAGLERTAIELARTLDAIPADAEGGLCPDDELAVSWRPPDARAVVGAFVTPIGPAPTATTDAVSGVVICRTSTYGYMGFEARWADDRWDVVDVPFVGDEDGEEPTVPPPSAAEPAQPQPPSVDEPAQPQPSAPAPDAPPLAMAGTVTGPIEGYAAYEPQRTCDPSAKPGTRMLASSLLREYTGSRSLGIVRGCGVGGRSEHKEGRAFDWGVNVTRPAEKADAEAFLAGLLATDAAGNRDALARRMGIMYVIFDSKIWSAFRAADGWRPYSGVSPHRDHVHISLSWAGAMARTSYWSGSVPAALPVAGAGGDDASSSRSSASPEARSTHTPRTTTDPPVTAPEPTARRRSTPPDTTASPDGTGERHRRWTPPAPTDPASDQATEQPHDRRGREQLPTGDASTTTTTTWVPRHRPTTTTTTAPPEQVPSEQSPAGSAADVPDSDSDAVADQSPSTTTPASTTTTTLPPWRDGSNERRRRH